MKFIKKVHVILAISTIVLIFLIFKWINYLSLNKYIILEPFTFNKETIDLPLTTTYSCKNFCGPTARCSMTGQQCTADIDCTGCQPYSPPLQKNKTSSVPGNNDAGKLTWGVTPQYSPLTSGYGTQETVITKNMYSKPYMPNFGINTWFNKYIKGEKLFDKRYKPRGLEYMPNYPQRYSMTGQFIEDGPFASNAVLPTTT